ncbi:MAG: NUDIX domain-containing protein [Bacilli bacterium]|nr:NUDIX domain-containing protein [Bacilli bacterium]MEE0014811.1 NUDIX domain-containing protein [Bacilli bacterium]
MDKFKEIRPVVLGIAKKNNKVLVSKGYDKVKNETFYRCIGGGIEFLENSKDALKREYQEELNANIKIEEFLGIFENIFTYNGKNAHELILFYNVSIEDVDYKEHYHVVDGDVETDASWIDIDKFINKELKIYPEIVLDYLK